VPLKADSGYGGSVPTRDSTSDFVCEQQRLPCLNERVGAGCAYVSDGTDARGRFSEKREGMEGKPMGR
jgi:hypothetical protein